MPQDHPHIVKPYEVYEYRKQIYLILELCDGGDLYTRTPYSERESARILKQVLLAVGYMVSQAITQPANLFESKQHFI